MLHIEWILSSPKEVNALRDALRQSIKTTLGNGFSFTESHLTLALDLGQLYSYLDMQKALRLFEHTRVANRINGFITNVEFRH